MSYIYKMADSMLTLHNHPLLVHCAGSLFFPQSVWNWTEMLICSIYQNSPFLGALPQMAHRLLVRRIWTLAAKDIRCPPATTATTGSSCFSTSLHSNTTQVSFLASSRSLALPLLHTFCRGVSFNVQDQEDFTERVINNQLPILVDFHAQWVLMGGMIMDYLPLNWIDNGN